MVYWSDHVRTCISCNLSRNDLKAEELPGAGFIPIRVSSSYIAATCNMQLIFERADMLDLR